MTEDNKKQPIRKHVVLYQEHDEMIQDYIDRNGLGEHGYSIAVRNLIAAGFWAKFGCKPPEEE